MSNCNSSQDHLDQNRLTFRLLPTLVTSIGVLILLSVGSVLIVNWVADRRIVREFASRHYKLPTTFAVLVRNLSVPISA